MKVPRSLLPSITVGFASLILLVLGTPISGFAQTPHTCPNGAHQGQSLGAVPSYTFHFEKNCSPYTSNTVEWKFTIYKYSDNTLLCNSGPFTVGQTYRDLPCGPTPPLPLGSYPKVKVVISYKTTQGGSWMTHTELYGN